MRPFFAAENSIVKLSHAKRGYHNKATSLTSKWHHPMVSSPSLSATDANSAAVISGREL